MSSSMYRFLLFYLSTIILFLATIAQQRLRNKIENVYWKIPPPPPTQWSSYLTFFSYENPGGCSKLGQQPLIRGRTPLCCPRTWSYKYFCSQLRWYGRGKANQQLDCGNYFLVHSEWNLKSTLLVIPPGFTTKTKNKEISKGSYNTSGDPPWKPDAYLYHSSSRYHCTQERGSLAERWYLKQLLVTPEQEQRAF